MIATMPITEPRQRVMLDTLAPKIARSVALLQQHCPPEGYYLAFSGGKDSCVIKRLAEMAGVAFDAHYAKTTIDPPELVNFIREFHSDVEWQVQKCHMMTAIVNSPNGPPTRKARWCCENYKESASRGRSIVLGVRAAESPRRAKTWRELSEGRHGEPAICPIVYWTDSDVWEFIRREEIPYCKLYDEGFKRLGCIGCPLASTKQRDKDFARWPGYERIWRKAIIANWEKWHDVPNTKTGKPRFHARFSGGQDMWEWWRCGTVAKPITDGCQSELLWTNADWEE